MAFDKVAYDASVLRPLRRRREPLRESDLLDAFALFSYMSATELRQRMNDVRAYWSELAVVSDPIKHVCIQFLQLDRLAQREYGAAFETISWWREHGRLDPAENAGRGSDVFNVGPATVDHPDADVSTARPAAEAVVTEPVTVPRIPPARHEGSSRHEGSGAGSGPAVDDHDLRARRIADMRGPLDRDRRRSTSWPRIQRGSGDRASSAAPQRPAADDPAQAGPPSQTAHEFVAGQLQFKVEKITADGSLVTVRASWIQPDEGDIEVRSSTMLPEGWLAGQAITPQAMATYGTLEPAKMDFNGQRRSIPAQVGAGYHVFVPFIILADKVIVGQPFPMTVARSVQSLDVLRQAESISISWMWPPDCGIAEVEIRTGGTRKTRRISSTAVGERGMLIAPDSDESITVAVRSVEVLPDGTEVLCQPEIRTVPPKPAIIRWRPTKRAGKAREWQIDLIADKDCPNLRLVFAGSLERVMPQDLTEPAIIPIEEFVITLVAGTYHRVVVKIPVDIYRARSYWIRCFVESELPVSVDDPAIEYMRAA